MRLKVSRLKSTRPRTARREAARAARPKTHALTRPVLLHLGWWKR